METRYAALRIGEALKRKCDYSRACKELVILLREVYSVAPKSLQTAIFQDSVAAFRTLQEARWCSSVDFSAAQILAQACECVLPRHKKFMAVGEHKSAAIIWQRYSKHSSKQDEGIPLPTDVMIHVFSFLDGISLATASCVCRSWRDGAMEGHLWQKKFEQIAADTPLDPKILVDAGFKLADEENLQSCKLNSISIEGGGCWKKAFQLLILRSPKLLCLFSRAQCLSCNKTFWPSELSGQNESCKRNEQGHKLRPLLPEQVICYVLTGSRQVHHHPRGRSSNAVESDSDDDHLPYAKLWEYAKRLR